VRWFTKARNIFSLLVDSEPNRQKTRLNYAQATSWLADASRALGDYTGAMELREQERDTYTEILREDSNNKDATQFLPVVDLAMGRLAIDANSTKDAISYFIQAIASAEKLSNFDRENAVWRELTIRAKVELAEALLADRNCVHALATTKQLGDEITRLASTDPTTAGLAILQARSRVVQSRCELLSGDEASSLTTATSVKDSIEAVAEMGNRPEMVFVLAESELTIGDALSALGQSEAAISNWNDALERLNSLGENYTPRQKPTIVRLLRRLGRDAEAEVIDRRVPAKDTQQDVKDLLVDFSSKRGTK
jgi:tetratricopeptide (TPR) repeat protein